MVDFKGLIDKLSSQEEAPEQLEQIIIASGDQIADEIRDGKLKVVDCVKELNPILTNGSYEIRSNGVKLLAKFITKLPKSLFNEKEIELLTEFMCLRLIDHKSMEQSVLTCLSHFIDCDNKPARYNKQLIEFIKTKANIHRMEARVRHRIYELLKKIITEKRRMSNLIDGDLIYSLVSILEGENNPDNLMLCFGVISYILKNFTDLDPYIDDIFEWLSSYYPVDYTPADKDDSEAINIQRSDLVRALYECFYATPLNADNLQTLLLEKLDSNILSSKLESLECLIKCYEQFPLSSIQKYNSTLWTAIRMNCLRKIGTIEPNLLETSLKTLEALSRRLSEDGDSYFMFISDMYEELAIAFRKPEMDLFEPAAKLLTHACLPSIVGFNYVLEKILPASINALDANELKPLSGLAYMFEQFHLNYPQSQLKADLNNLIKTLFVKVSDKSGLNNVNALRLIEALVGQRVELPKEDLDTITTNLWIENIQSNLDLEKYLALICLYYNKNDIISDIELANYSLGSLIELIHSFKFETFITSNQQNQDCPSSLSKLSVYLRLLIIELETCLGTQIDDIDQATLNVSLTKMRELATTIRSNKKVAERIAIIHAIIVNKLKSDNVGPILMSIFSSNYCQNLVPNDANDITMTSDVYLPLIAWVFRSLVTRNHQLATPMVNLLLNFITSDKIDLDLALKGTRVFSFIQSSDDSFSGQRHYQIFSLYRQKFYMLTSKEVKIRLELQKYESKRNLLLCTIALQIPNLPLAVYKKDYDWLVRQFLKVLSSSSAVETNQMESRKDFVLAEKTDEELFNVLFGCTENLIQKDLSEQLVSFLSSLIDLTLKIAQGANSLHLRKQALICLTKIATSFKESDLLVFRSTVVDKLRPCLADKKRVVREAAAEARLKWVIIGQPIGSSTG